MEDESIPTTSKLEIEGLIRQICASSLDPAAKDKIERMLRTVLSLVLLLKKKNTSITKLKKLIFGKKAERDGDSKSRYLVTEIDGLAGDQDPQLRKELNHREAPLRKSEQMLLMMSALDGGTQ